MTERYYKIGEIAELLNIEQYTLRYLESSLNLKIRRDDRGDRIYTDSDIETFKLIIKLKNEKGLNTTAIKHALNNLEEHQETSVAPVENNHYPDFHNLKTLAEKIVEQNTALLKKNEEIENRLESMNAKLEKYNSERAARIEELIELWRNEQEQRNKSWIDRLRGK